MFIASMISLFFALASYPLTTYFAKHAGKVDGIVWAIITFQLACGLMLSMAYSKCFDVVSCM